MALNLNAKELAEVDSKRKKNRPTYYNAGLGKDVEISEDFEAFLILTPASQKKQAVSWIGQTISMKQRNLDVDLLLTEAIQNELEAADSSKTELERQTSSFDTFRASLSTDKFASIPELSTMLTDLQYGLDDLIFVKERIVHLKAMLNTVETDIKTMGLSEEKVKQTQSWIGPLTAY